MSENRICIRCGNPIITDDDSDICDVCEEEEEIGNMNILGEIDSQGIKWSPTKPPRFVNADAKYAGLRGAAMPDNMRISIEEINAWIRDIQLTIRHLKHPDAPVLPIDTSSNAEMRKRLQNLMQVLNTMNCQGPITITSSCSLLKQEHILEIFSGIIDTIQWDKLENTTHAPHKWKREFLEALNIPIEFKKKLGYKE